MAKCCLIEIYRHWCYALKSSLFFLLCVLCSLFFLHDFLFLSHRLRWNCKRGQSKTKTGQKRARVPSDFEPNWEMKERTAEALFSNPSRTSWVSLRIPSWLTVASTVQRRLNQNGGNADNTPTTRYFEHPGHSCQKTPTIYEYVCCENKISYTNRAYSIVIIVIFVAKVK